MLVVIHSETTRGEVALPPTPRRWSLFVTVSQSQTRLGEAGGSGKQGCKLEGCQSSTVFFLFFFSSFQQPAGCHLGHWSLLVCSPIILLQLCWSDLAQQITGWGGGAAAMSSQLKKKKNACRNHVAGAARRYVSGLQDKFLHHKFLVDCPVGHLLSRASRTYHIPPPITDGLMCHGIARQ